MVTINLTKNSFQINQVDLVFPPTIQQLKAILGDCRHTKKPKNTIFTWDQLGLMAYSNHGETIEGLLLVWDDGNFDFSPTKPFSGIFTINAEEATSYYKSNRSKRVKLFKTDEGGAFIMNNICAWFDVEEYKINAIEIKAHLAPPQVTITPLAVPDAFKHLVPLWLQWVEEITKLVPTDNRYYNLTHGITEKELQAAKQFKEFTMPDTLIYFYAIHNVAWDAVTAAFSFAVNGWSYDLLPFERIYKGWSDIDDLQLGEDCEPADLKGYSEKVKANDYANPNWIPIAEGRNGDWLLFDTDPSGKGTYGQIIELQNESWTREVVANSLEDLLQKAITALQSGQAKQLDFILGK